MEEKKKVEKKSYDLVDFLEEGNSLKKESSGKNTFKYDKLIDEFVGYYLVGMDTTVRVLSFIKSDSDITKENLSKLDYM